ncbi:MAG: BatA domain-containing protein [Planctomycetaceae bacterium]
MFPWLANLFASPSLLWWVGLAGAPLVIHLLYRRKFRETPWAAMKFLLEAARKNARRLRLEQLLLLALRMLLILLAVLALAEPLVKQAGTFFQAGLPVHRVLVLDASASLGARAGDEELFSRAQRLAREIIERSQPGDALNLVRLSSLPPRVIVQTPSFSASSVLEELDRLEVSPASAGLLTGLEETVPLLKSVPEISRKEVYLLSDFQRATWDLGSGDEGARLRGVLKKIGDAAELVLIDTGEPALANVGITAIESLEMVPIANRPVRVRVSLRNFGSEAVADRDLQLLVDDRLVDRRTISLAAGAETSELFTPLIDSAGPHRIEARLADDSLPFDNRRWLTLAVKDRVRVLCVNGRGSGRGASQGTDYLQLALAPRNRRGGLTSGERSVLEPVVIKDTDFGGQDLSLFDCVWLVDVRRLTEREMALLEVFARQGGGVVFGVGDQVQVRDYNDLLYRDGKGLLPARLGERQGDPGVRDSVYRFDPGDFAHPILAAFQGNPDAGLESTISYARFAVTGWEEAGARVALRFDDGAPAILEKPLGLGRVILVTTSLDEQWSLWPLWPSYVPLVQEITQVAALGRGGQRGRLVGDSLEAAVPVAVGDASIEIQRPAGERDQVRASVEGTEARFVFGPAVEPGIYEARIPPPSLKTELFAVNFDTIESRLTNFTPNELREGPLAGLDVTLGRTAIEPETQTSSSFRPASGGLTRPLLYLLLYLLFVEQAMAWNFQAGLWLLCPPLAALLWWRRGR